MSDMTFEQVLESAKQLSLEERALLVEQLQGTLLPPITYGSTREELLAEFERRKAAGVFNNLESLRGKFGRPDLNISEEELNATIREIRDQWKEDWEGLDDNNP
jgi:hypothetical protein